MNDDALALAETVCKTCIDSLAPKFQLFIDKIKELEQENKRLSAQSQGLTYEQQYLIDIVGQLVAVLRLKPDTLPRGYAELIRAWDKCDKAERTMHNVG